MAEICDVPILSSTKCVTLTTAQKTLEELGITINPDTTNIQVRFEGRWTFKEIGRYSRDPSASLTATVGAPIYPRASICLNKNELKSVFRTVSGELSICIHQYKTLEVCDFRAEYHLAIAQLLPDGFAWEAKLIKGSVLYRLINATAKMMSDLHCRELDLQKEFYASSCVELCENWDEETFGPDIQECLHPIELSKAQRISSVVAKIIAGGAITTEDYIAIGAALGLVVEITEDFANHTLIFDIVGADISPMLACDMACARLNDGPDMNFILAFKCIMEKIRRLGIKHEFTLDGEC